MHKILTFILRIIIVNSKPYNIFLNGSPSKDNQGKMRGFGESSRGCVRVCGCALQANA